MFSKTPSTASTRSSSRGKTSSSACWIYATFASTVSAIYIVNLATARETAREMARETVPADEAATGSAAVDTAAVPAAVPAVEAVDEGTTKTNAH